MNTFEAQLTQYVRPTGFAKQVTADLPTEVELLYKKMMAAGCRLECEVLTTSEVSVTVWNTHSETDIDHSITANGPSVIPGIVDMLKRKPWIKHLLDQLRELGGKYESLMEERRISDENEVDDTRSTESIDEDIDDLLDETMTIARTLNDIGE